MQEGSRTRKAPKEWFEGSASRKQLWHFQKQLFERFNIILEPGDEEFMHKQITSGIAELVHSTKEDKPDQVVYSLSLLRNNELVDFDVVYSLDKKHLITALPPNSYCRQREARSNERLLRGIRSGRNNNAKKFPRKYRY